MGSIHQLEGLEIVKWLQIQFNGDEALANHPGELTEAVDEIVDGKPVKRGRCG